MTMRVAGALVPTGALSWHELTIEAYGRDRQQTKKRRDTEVSRRFSFHLPAGA